MVGLPATDFMTVYSKPPGGLVCRCTCWVIAESDIQSREFWRIVDLVVQRMLKSVRQKLLLQIHRDESRDGVDVFVACHLLPQNIPLSFDLDIWFGSRHYAPMKLFPQRR
jgi:hypothetical protein